MSENLRMAQYGTKHGHAQGVLQVMLDHPEVEVVGVYEPDSHRRKQLEGAGDGAWGQVKWVDSPSEFSGGTNVVAV